MPVPYREFCFDLAAIIEPAHDDPALLDRLLRLGQRYLGGLGLTLGEIGNRPGVRSRIVAATGAASWALGRPVHPEVVKASIQPFPAPYRMELDILEDIAVRQLGELGIGWMLLHPIYVNGRPVVVLAAFYASGQTVDADQTAMMKLIAASIGYLYQVDTAARSTRPPALEDHELFMAVTSHELRTPVTVIKSNAETLRDHWDALTDNQRRESAGVIGQRAGDLARMVDRLLDASTGIGPLRSERGPFDLLETLQRAAADLPADLRRRLELGLPAELPMALGNRAALPSILTELVTNAYKYSPKSTPIMLTASADRCTVFFRVADRGIGIPADRIAHTFDRFWQGEAGDDRRYGGAGLGLFLVRKTIERQNGWVSLRPRDGGGTVAEVRLPRGDIGVGEA